MGKLFTSPAGALVEYLNAEAVEGGKYSKIKVIEMKNFKAACSEAEWQELGHQAAKLLGGELSPLVIVK